ncbi:MAG: hypothetical protein KKE50_00625 [Nanoarchaeota archaeon]|nr:hypothetical protein [Nanoarchaeota archaeon]
MEITLTNKNRKLAIIITIAALVVLGAMLASITFEFDIVENLVMSWILTTFYAIFAFLIMDPIKTVFQERRIPVIQRIEVPVIKEIIKEIEKPIIREVPIQIPVENQTIRVVDRPVIQKVYIEKPRKKLNIPKFNFIASSEARVYHTRFCRLGKLVKKKYKIHNNSKSFFEKKRFKACKVCIQHKKKI